MGFTEWNLSIKESAQEIAKKISKEINKQIKLSFAQNVAGITSVVRHVVKRNIKETDVYTRADFDLGWALGMVDLQDRLDAIIEKYVENIEIIQISPKNIAVKFKDDNIFAQLLAMPEAEFLTPENDHNLWWLSWLLTKDEQPIIMGYSIEYGDFGRTGGAHMVKKDGSNWKVPEYAAGNVTNNFLNLGLITAEPEIQTILPKLFNKTLSSLT